MLCHPRSTHLAGGDTEELGCRLPSKHFDFLSIETDTCLFAPTSCLKLLGTGEIKTIEDYFLFANRKMTKGQELEAKQSTGLNSIKMVQ